MLKESEGDQNHVTRNKLKPCQSGFRTSALAELRVRPRVRTRRCTRHLAIVNGAAIAILGMEDESVRGWKLTLSILIAATAFAATPQEKAQTTGKTVLKANDLSGAEMYRTYCASCHGIDGKGSGPAGRALKKAPPDLTQLAKHNNGHLPDFRILRIIDGYGIRAHGSRDMPVWGDYFRTKQPDEWIVAVREHNLVEYIRSIQQR